MLLAALGATVIGFILLIVALVTANLWLAIACVVVSVVGVGLLLGDVLTYRRGERDKADGDRAAAWSPGDRSDDESDEDDAPAAKTAAATASEGEPAEAASESPDDDAAREAGTVGHEEFGRHDSPDDDARPTTQFAMGPLGGPTGWEHESPADTDDEATRGLFAPGKYDPDMTDQIPQIRIDQAWGAEWTPPKPPESDDPDQK
ncbi:hypothetical protein FK268_00785 [Tsukamurella sputi]|uniref:DUF308 domain-containing protein n=1 Tax=Tsukamurella sputi TaxID=2591848 RepID=A0A5C5RTN2_9ACTN|nr:hypothetical protein [Tsukamurella sputi]TWS25840.1 hypothetical protein FK268_00785 [Tsukamurella sputi]